MKALFGECGPFMVNIKMGQGQVRILRCQNIKWVIVGIIIINLIQRRVK